MMVFMMLKERIGALLGILNIKATVISGGRLFQI